MAGAGQTLGPLGGPVAGSCDGEPGPAPRTDYIQEFIRLFLTGDALQNCLLYLFQNAPGEGLTPIVDTVVTTVNNPVTLALTQFGIAPFRNSPELVIPYTRFSLEQRNFLCDLCLDEETSMDVSTHASSSNAFYVRLPSSKTRYLENKEILLALCRLVCSSQTHTDAQMQSAIIKLLMQKLQSTIKLPSDVSIAVFEQIKQEYGIQ